MKQMKKQLDTSQLQDLRHIYSSTQMRKESRIEDFIRFWGEGAAEGCVSVHVATIC